MNKCNAMFLVLFMFMGCENDSKNISLQRDPNDPTAKFTIDIEAEGLIKKEGKPAQVSGMVCYPPSNILSEKQNFWCQNIQTKEDGKFKFSVTAYLPMSMYLTTLGMHISIHSRVFFLFTGGKWYESTLSSVKMNQEASFIELLNIAYKYISDGQNISVYPIESSIKTENRNDVGYVLDVYVEYDLSKKHAPTPGAGISSLNVNFGTNPDLYMLDNVTVVDSDRSINVDGKEYYIDFNNETSNSATQQ